MMLSVDAKENCLRLPGMGKISKSTDIEPGTYVIRIASGTFSFWGEDVREEPFILFWIHCGKFTNLATGVETRSTFSSLNGYNDTCTINVTEKTTLYAFFIDPQNKDNTGTINLSILPA